MRRATIDDVRAVLREWARSRGADPARSMRPIRLAGLLLVVAGLLAGGAAVLAAGSAPALRSTSPADGASVQSAPAVTASYDQALHPGSGVVVTDSTDVSIGGTTTLSQDGATVSFTPSSALTPAGSPYTATATVRSAADEQQVVSTWRFSIDVTAPQAPTVASVDGDSTSPATGNDPSPAIMVSGVVAGDTVRLLEGTTERGAAVVPPGATTVTFNAGAAEDAALTGDGEHGLTATAADPAGNVSSASDPFFYTLDTAGPAAPTIASVGGTGTSPASGNDPTPAITVTGAGAGDTVRILEGSTVKASKVVPAPGPLGSPSVTFNGTASSTEVTLNGDGPHTLIAEAVDAAGNLSPASTGFVYDLDTGSPTPPTITSVNGVDATPAVGNDLTPAIVVSEVEAGDVVQVFEGSSLRAARTVPAGGSTVTFNQGPLDVEVVLAGDGDHTLTATSTDPQGNGSGTSPSFVYTLDTGTTAPALASTSPAGSSTGKPPATVSAAYGERLDRVRSSLSLTNGPGNSVAGTVGFSADAMTITFTPSSTLTEGGNVYSARAVVRDGNGNATTSTWTFSVDTTGPAAPTLTSVDGQTTSPAAGTDASPAIVVSGVEAGHTVRIRDDGAVVGTKVVPGGATSVTFNPAATDTDVLLEGDGSHPLTATATDPAGNPSAASAAFEYTLTTTFPAPDPPTVSSVDGRSTSPAAGTDPTPTIVVSGVQAGHTVSVLDGTAVRGSKIVASGATSVTFNAAPADSEVVLSGDGAHSLTATATNTSGSTSEPSGAFEYALTTTFPGEFQSLVPARVLDTRDGTGGFSAPVGPAATISPTVVGKGGVPATGVSAVVLNVTVTQPSAASYLTVFPSGTTRPDTANLTFVPGQTVPNLVVARVGADGKVSVYNNAGSTHVIFDVLGWFSDASGPAGGRFNPLAAARILDTRTGTGGFSAPVGPGATIAPTVAGRGGIPSGASAAVLNVTVTQPTAAASYLTVFPTGAPRPNTANLTFVAGQTTTNLVVAKVGTDGKVSVYNHAGNSQVIFDVVGWFSTADRDEPGARYSPLRPSRILDTRIGTGGFSAPVGAGATISPKVTGVGGVPATGVSTVVLNVTVTQPTAASYLTVFPAGAARPNTANLTFGAGQTVTNLLMAKVGADGKVSVYNQAGTSHVIFDVVGWYGG